MSKPEGIPQDVWDVSDDMAFYDPAIEDKDGSLSRYKLRAAIASAIIAAKAEERYACAEAADDALERDGSMQFVQAVGWIGLRSSVSTAIRSRT